MTAAERRALAFFAGLGALGLGARAAGFGAPPPLDLPGDGAAAERRALAAQLEAVDSARARARPAGRGWGRGRARGARRPGLTGAPGAADTRHPGAPPAAPPADPPADLPADLPAPSPAGPVDADRADSAAFERLPGVGPALARRLVADRRARGPFGSMAGLSRVPGVGPALERRLAPLVTFSAARGAP